MCRQLPLTRCLIDRASLSHSAPVLRIQPIPISTSGCSRPALAARPQNELAGLSRSYYLRQAQLVANYVPLFALSSAKGLEARKISWQIASDHERFLTLASATLLELMPEAANPRVGADG
jgi:hypothetical protein